VCVSVYDFMGVSCTFVCIKYMGMCACVCACVSVCGSVHLYIVFVYIFEV